MRCLSVALLAAALACGAPSYTVYVLPHTHIDLEWYWTYSQTRVIASKLLRQALDTLRKDPKYAFTQDQRLALEPFWNDLSATEKEFLRQAVRQGRFEVATGSQVQPENAQPDFESLTRQFLLAKPWLESTFGGRIVTGWNIDTFGHTIQMPQLMRKAGLRYFVFMRDVRPDQAGSVKCPFYWRAPDGSRILTYWISSSYTVDARSVPAVLKRHIEHNVPGNDKILITWGSDLSEPTETSGEIEEHVRKAAAGLGISVKDVLVTTPGRYFADVERSGVPLPTYDYDFNPPFANTDLRGLYGERPKSKLAERSAEEMLTSAEKLASLAALEGEPYPTRTLREAWEKVLLNQSHDGMGGSHTDAVYHDVMSRYGGAIEAGRSVLDGAMYALSRRIDTRGGGSFPFLVFNTQSFARTEVVRYDALFKEKLRNLRLTNLSGQPVPFRTLFLGVPKPGASLQMAVIEFLGKDLPPMGHRLYRIEPSTGEPVVPRWRPAPAQIAGKFFTLRLDPRSGLIASLVDRRSGKELLDTTRYFGNELVIHEERNPSMEGIFHFAGTELRGSSFVAASAEISEDALGVRVRIQGPFLTGRRTQEISLWNDLPRIDFTTKLEGFPGRDGLLMAVFPLRNASRSLYETHHAVTDRPDGIYNAHTWVDMETPGGGVALFNQGTGGHFIERGLLRLILLRSITAYPSYHAPEGSEAGEHTFSYSLYPHSAGWGASGVMEMARSFNAPVRSLAAGQHAGSVPPEHSWLSISGGAFQITAFKQAEEGAGWILRGCETRGSKSQIRLNFGFQFSQAWIADTLERPITDAHIREGVVEFEAKPFEFVTLRLRRAQK